METTKTTKKEFSAIARHACHDAAKPLLIQVKTKTNTYYVDINREALSLVECLRNLQAIRALDWRTVLVSVVST